MSTKRSPRLLAVLILIAFSLFAAACGDSDSSSADDPSEQAETSDAAGSVDEADSNDSDSTTSSEAPEPDPEPEPEISSVGIAGDGFLLSTQAWIAEDQGYFAENNVEADVSLFGTGIEAIQGVIARQADLGHALDFAVLSLVAAAGPADGYHLTDRLHRRPCCRRS